MGKLSAARNRKLRGQCVDCSKKPAKNHVRCTKCLKIRSDHQAKIRKKRLKTGKCTRCGRKRGTKKYLLCKKCRDRKNDPKVKASAKKHRQKIKDAAYKAYGGYICNCCGETESKFLSIDHIGGGGRNHRAYGTYMYYWLKKNNYPGGFQILCHNCNLGSSLNNDICPHKTKQA